jgi:FdhD protein
MPPTDPGSIRTALGVLRPGIGARDSLDRALAIEAPVAISYNGIGYAVMMATPVDLEDFAIGFSLSEGLIQHASEVIGIDSHAGDLGWTLRIEIASDRMVPVIERARQRVTESSCGLCGLESLEQVMRPLPAIMACPAVSDAALFGALAALGDHQLLNAATGAVHGAAFCLPDGSVQLVREDVGRHNALDKLIGVLARAGTSPDSGFFLLTARCSYELVEKTITARCPLLVTISAPTTLAVARARAHGLTLISLARSDAMLVASDPHKQFS